MARIALSWHSVEGSYGVTRDIYGESQTLNVASRLGLTIVEVEQDIADAILHLDRELTVMEQRGRG